MKVERFFTSESLDDPFDCIEWKTTSVLITNHKTGESIFDIPKAEIPAHWAKNSHDILVSKYFRLRGVPTETVKIPEEGVPEWLQRSEPKVSTDIESGEVSAKQVFHRLAGFWAYWGWKHGYFDEENDAKNFYAEIIYCFCNQLFAPNTPQWYNSGLHWAYGIKGEKKGYWRVDSDTGIPQETEDFFTNPCIHACFINHVGDNLFEKAGIYELLTTEAKCYVGGGGSGVDISPIRSKYEFLSNGNPASGVMEFAEYLFDPNAKLIKSGSSQRRPANIKLMRCDHPEIEDFVDWKLKEEGKAQALIRAGYSSDLEGEAYRTVSGQSTNISVRILDRFMNLLRKDGDWNLISRTTGEVIRTIKARELWDQIIRAAYECGDPGIQFHDTINEWYTCLNDGEANGSNPCSEFVFTDGTACNLASLNIGAFFDAKQRKFHSNKFFHAVKLVTIMLDITNAAAGLPSRHLAKGTWDYRAIGLGFTGFGAWLMRMGIPYDSPEACHLAASVTSLMTACAYNTSAEMAKAVSPFPQYSQNSDCMLKVIRNHIRCSNVLKQDVGGEFEGLTHDQFVIDHSKSPINLREELELAWEQVYKTGKEYGFRNAFVTLIQPSGTLTFILGDDTSAIEPDFSLVKLKKLSGGSYMKIVNESLREALEYCGYSEREIEDIRTYTLGHNTLIGAPHINTDTLAELGITPEEIEEASKKLESSVELRYVFNLTDATSLKLGIEKGDNLFKKLGFTKAEYLEAQNWILGYGTLEDAPHMKEEHLPIFDCSNKSGSGQRFLRWMAHVNMMAAVSPFVSGAISKTVNLPSDATGEDIGQVYSAAYEAGIKCITVYRDGSKQAQPLNNPSNMTWWDSQDVPEVLIRGERRGPRKKRTGFCQDVTITDEHGKKTRIWINCFEYEDGSLCEVWLDVSKENQDFMRSMKWWARTLSNALQYGQPLEEIADSFLLDEGGPSGRTNHPYITNCTSIPDLVMKILALEYLYDTSWCARAKPQPHEVRCAGKAASKVASMPSTASYYKQFSYVSKCPVCNSTNLAYFPCECCRDCGQQIGDCSV